MRKARYVCFEGTEGVGKTTQVDNLVKYLEDKGFKVLKTKEPGTHHAPLTMDLRKIMLDSQYESQMTAVARELISQTIRSIHLEKVIEPALYEYDFIIQDRGILSGLAYGVACGNSLEFLNNLATEINTINDNFTELYDDVLYLRGNVGDKLKVAIESKQEFESGDVIESRGVSFMEQVGRNMNEFSSFFSTHCLEVDNKNIDQVFEEVLKALKLR